MDTPRLETSAWLKGISCPNSSPLPSPLCTPKLALIWAFLRVSSEAKAVGDGTENTAGPSRRANSDSRREDPWHSLERTLGQLRALSGRQATDLQSAKGLQVQEHACKAYLQRLHHVTLALHWQKGQLAAELKQAERSPDSAEHESVEESGQAASVAQLHSFAFSLKQQVASVVRSGNLGAVGILWEAASSTARKARMAASDSDKDALLRCSLGLLDICKAQTLQATEELAAAKAGIDLMSDATELQKCTPAFTDAGIPDPAALLHAGRKEHVKIFFKTRRAADLEQDAARKLGSLRATLDRLCGGSEAGAHRKRLLTLIADIAGNRAATQALELEMVELKKKQNFLGELQQEIEESKEALINSRMRNLMTDQVVHDLVSNGASFLGHWLPNSDAVKKLLSEEIQQYKTDFLVKKAIAASLLLGETESLAQAPIQALHLPWESAVCEQKSPAQLRKEVKHIVRRFAGLGKCLDILNETSALAGFSPWHKLALTHAEYVRDIERECEELRAMEGEASAALQLGQQRVPQVLQVWWEQPALGAVPWIQHGGRNAKEWLMHIRTLHAPSMNAAK